MPIFWKIYISYIFIKTYTYMLSFSRTHKFGEEASEVKETGAEISQAFK